MPSISNTERETMTLIITADTTIRTIRVASRGAIPPAELEAVDHAFARLRTDGEDPDHWELVAAWANTNNSVDVRLCRRGTP